jgi:protein deglycase
MRDAALTILFPGAVLYEVMCAIQILSKHLAIEMATPRGANHVDETGLTVSVNLGFGEALSRNYRCILVPGGDLGAIADDEELSCLLRENYAHGAVLGAICAGPLALARAGLLKGRAYTQAGRYPASVEHLWSGATFQQTSVATSDRIVTALPEAHIDFAIEIARQLGLFRDEAEAEGRREFYKGTFSRDWSAIGAMRDG